MNLYKELDYFEKYNLDKETVKHIDHQFSFKEDYKYFEDFDVIIRSFSTTILNPFSRTN